MLEVNYLQSGYGKLKIINDVNMNIKKGEIVSIIGRNGVGKSTFMKTIIGILPAVKGVLQFKDIKMDVTKWPAYKRAKYGMAYVPQGHGIFPQLTVEENLKIGTLINQAKIEENFERVYAYFPRIKERCKQVAGTMSGGEQAMLSIGRVLVNKPEIILLDEPSEGVQPNIVHKIGEIILQISKEMGLTVLMVEQHLSLIQQITQRAYVMDKGTIVRELSHSDINNYELVKKYLSV